MIRKPEILAVANEKSLRPDIVEKDYVLGWMLAGIFAQDELRDKWVFKGGTCFKKCYFETYRFSEDLDFTLLDPADLNEEKGPCLGCCTGVKNRRHSSRKILPVLYQLL